ncbi:MULTISPECIES: helix-turn-helix domain-containing protein [unclassified Microbacterium]|uniref:helix-turn-helix domain-containing protein n=1 Tax=unclassified Microbacterium TaxID=2609290 RepID=UPI000EA86F5B|nr:MULTISPECIES: helix-turn-helix domain-containing protein [unclassified Microbacterium]MBT2485736.1 helix-turn-helix domain-containing protein [Microbacterium sp. ISL-108]RKN68504.1 DNA-binding protein [Microbacterium sp. CGR2]
MPTATSTTPWGTVNEAAAQLRVDPRTIRRQIAAGRIRAVQLGKIFRVDMSSLTPDADPIAAHVAAIVADAPPLTPEQRDKIAAILGGGADA